MLDHGAAHRADGEHGIDGDGGAMMDVPRVAEDDYEDGLQDMDMMPGDMGMGGALAPVDSSAEP